MKHVQSIQGSLGIVEIGEETSFIDKRDFFLDKCNGNPTMNNLVLLLFPLNAFMDQVPLVSGFQIMAVEVELILQHIFHIATLIFV